MVILVEWEEEWKKGISKDRRERHKQYKRWKRKAKMSTKK